MAHDLWPSANWPWACYSPCLMQSVFQCPRVVLELFCVGSRRRADCVPGLILPSRFFAFRGPVWPVLHRLQRGSRRHFDHDGSKELVNPAGP